MVEEEKEEESGGNSARLRLIKGMLCPEPCPLIYRLHGTLGFSAPVQPPEFGLSNVTRVSSHYS